MKKLILVGSVAALSLAMGAAYAGSGMADDSNNNSGFYIGAEAGTNYLQNMYLYDANAADTGSKMKFKWGWNGALDVGYATANGWRAELQAGYLTNDMDGVDVGSIIHVARDEPVEGWAYLVNGYYDINTNSPWVPYFGVGLGSATLHVDIVSGHSVKTTNFAYQGIIGIGYHINSNLRVFGEYRRLETNTSHIQYGGKTFTPSYYQNNLINIGVNYFF